MAVQAQHQSNNNNNVFSPDLRARTRNDGLQIQHNSNNNILAHILLNNGGGGALTVLSDKSDLTCNASAPRKRSREDVISSPSSMALSHHQNLVSFPSRISGGVPQPQHFSQTQSRVYGSVGTSTSGRPAVAAASPPVCLPLAEDLVSHVYQQSLEVDALVRLQTDRLRSELEGVRKRQCRDLISVMGNQVAKRIKEKEMELERASLRNAELEERVRQAAAESQIWFNVAKNNEAVVSGLKNTLEQVLIQQNRVADGYNGDSDPSPFPADDAESCCFVEGGGAKETADSAAAARRENEELRGRTACRMCGEREVCVLLLPCRHLCLCKDCEPRLDCCPVCHATKNASLQIFLS